MRNDNPETVSSVQLALKTGSYVVIPIAPALAPGETFTYAYACDEYGRGDPYAVVGAEGIAVP